MGVRSMRASLHKQQNPYRVRGGFVIQTPRIPSSRPILVRIATYSNRSSTVHSAQRLGGSHRRALSRDVATGMTRFEHENCISCSVSMLNVSTRMWPVRGSGCPKPCKVQAIAELQILAGRRSARGRRDGEAAGCHPIRQGR